MLRVPDPAPSTSGQAWGMRLCRQRDMNGTWEHPSNPDIQELSQWSNRSVFNLSVALCWSLMVAFALDLLPVWPCSACGTVPSLYYGWRLVSLVLSRRFACYSRELSSIVSHLRLVSTCFPIVPWSSRCIAVSPVPRPSVKSQCVDGFIRVDASDQSCSCEHITSYFTGDLTNICW